MHLHCSNLAFRSTFVLQVDTNVRAPPSGSCWCYSYTQHVIESEFPSAPPTPSKEKKKRKEKAQNEACFTILKVGNNDNPGFTEKHTCRHHTHAHTMLRCRLIQRNIIRETISITTVIHSAQRALHLPLFHIYSSSPQRI